jgi:hypothetical protein
LSNIRWIALATVFAAVIFSLAAPQPAAVAANPPRTRIVHVYPWTPRSTLKPGYKIAGVVGGTCWTNSIAVQDAFRCMSGRYIYDPCFVPPRVGERRLACLAVPWGKITWFDLLKPLPRATRDEGRSATSAFPPWAEHLSNGVGCANAEGAVGLIRGRPLFFFCRPGIGWAGAPNRHTRLWAALYAPSDETKHLYVESVRIAWF